MCRWGHLMNSWCYGSEIQKRGADQRYKLESSQTMLVVEIMVVGSYRGAKRWDGLQRIQCERKSRRESIFTGEVKEENTAGAAENAVREDLDGCEETKHNLFGRKVGQPPTSNASKMKPKNVPWIWWLTFTRETFVMLRWADIDWHLTEQLTLWIQHGDG